MVEPYVQKKLWSDCLKRNYLTGQALTQVENLDEIDDIWARLESTFGDVQLLLQYKLCSLDKIGGLWKVKGDELLMNAISTLLNSMSELTDLASRFKLENELYYGGGVEKILYLMGEIRKRKFIRKNAGDKLKGPDAWSKLTVMLKRELLECEKLTLYAKSEQCAMKCSGFKNSKNDNKEGIDRKNNRSFNVTLENHELTCHICGKGYHVISQQGTYNSVQYFSCKVFADNKPYDRFKMLIEK